MNLVILMSVSGSICMVFSILLQNARRRFPLYKWQDLLLKTALILYLVPCPLALAARRFWEEAQKRAAGRLPDIRVSPYKASVLVSDDYRIVVNRGFAVLAAATVIALTVMVFRLSVEVRGYLSGKKAVMSADVYKEADLAEGELERLKEKVCLKRKVQVYEIAFPGGAFTMGYFHPVIMIPENLGKQQRDIVLLHEMYHIKRNDVLFKFLAAAAVCVHWFNPLIYLLPGLMNRNCELNCDERVAGNLSRDERILYGREIFRQAELAQEEKDILVRLSGDRSLKKPNLTVERVKNIMREDRKSSSRTAKCLMGVLTLVILIVSSAPVFAYDGVTVVGIYGEEEAVREQYEGFSGSDIIFTTDDNLLFETGDTEIRFDQQFVDEDGNIYEVDLNEGARAGCTHSTLVSGTYQKHEKNSSGGCVIKAYSSKRCADCGKVFLGDFISEFKYAKCPH